MEWIKREGTQTERPEDLDVTSSATTVYQRRNQKQEERENQDGTKELIWTYEEMEMSREEYDRGQAELASPLALALMQSNTELIAKNELLQIQVEMLLDALSSTDETEGE